MFDTEIFKIPIEIVVYIVLGYFSCALIKKDFEFANGIPRMIVFSLLLGWAAIPIALIVLVFRICKIFIVWLFELW